MRPLLSLYSVSSCSKKEFSKRNLVEMKTCHCPLVRQSAVVLGVLLSIALPLPLTAAEPSVAPPTVFMIGDSTMANKPLRPPNPERGWGQMLQSYFKDGVRIDNCAVNGRSSKSFRDEDRWAAVREQIKPGDYVIIQFGHNDEKRQDPKRFTEPFGEFKKNLELYVRETRVHKGLPILATPVVRRKFDGEGKLQDTHGDYTRAIRQVAEEQKVPLLDMEKRSAELVQQLGPEASKKLYKWIAPGEYANPAEGFQDDTHFNAYGASRMCDLAIADLRDTAPDLAKWLK